MFLAPNEIPPPLQPMTEAEVIRAMREHLEGLFPKTCPNCCSVCRQVLAGPEPVQAGKQELNNAP